jgi:GNAT superfamily N-acetyltransferase
MSTPSGARKIEFHPVTPKRWDDFQSLFGQRGACGGCWCMWWRLTQKEYDRQKGVANRRAMKQIIDSKQVPGILAYAAGQPIGWCSFGPREVYPRLERSRILKRVDEEPVWSVVCFFVARPFRRRGIATKLLQAAVKYARKKGARIVEGYPVEPKKDQVPDLFVYHGLAASFREAGFKEVARRSQTRPIMRYYIEK